MNVICLQEEAFYELIKNVYDYIKNLEKDAQDYWITDKEVMRILQIKSPSTMQKLRDSGAIRFSQISRKIILYDRRSINQYLEKHARKTF